MFLSAVLQAHTDTLPQTNPDTGAAANDTLEDTATTLPRLEKMLAPPAKDRVQPLPSAYRSRWV